MRSSMISGVLRVGRHQGMGDHHLQDEFDVYFARAAAAAAAASVFAAQSPIPSSASTYAADRCSLDGVDDGRRDSLPDIEISLLLDDDDDDDQHQDEDFRPRSPAVRTSSCRYPHRRQQRVKERHRGSASSPSAFSFTASSSVSCDQAMETLTAAAGRGVPDGASPIAAAASVASSRDDHHRGSMSGSSCLRAPSPRQELRCHSAPHSRSSSWKKIKRPVSFRDLKEVEQLQAAAAAADDACRASARVSLEDAINAKLQELKLLQADDCYVVRQFTTSPKGAIVNRGDSIKRRASSSASTASKSPTASPVAAAAAAAARSSIVGSVSAPDMPSASASVSAAASADGISSLPLVRGLSCHHDDHEERENRKFHVLVLGAEGVGKTSLLQQFMTSEYMAAVQTSFDDECEKTLSVLLDGEETMLEFIESNSITAIQDVWPSQQQQQQQQQQSVVSIYVFVYSLTARESLKFVVDQLHRLRETQSPADVHSKPAIVVANKTDLVRTRQVSEEEGRAVSRVMNCGYWEVSTVLNHQLDELLVRIVTRLRRSKGPSPSGGGQTASCSLEEEAEAEEEELEAQRCGSDSDDGCVKERSCVRSATDMIRNLFRKQKTVSKSCEYLL